MRNVVLLEVKTREMKRGGASLPSFNLPIGMQAKEVRQCKETKRRESGRQLPKSSRQMRMTKQTSPRPAPHFMLVHVHSNRFLEISTVQGHITGLLLCWEGPWLAMQGGGVRITL
jgi:hypothetical protein